MIDKGSEVLGGPLRLAVVQVCGGEGVTAGELASSEGIMLAESRDVVVVGWTGTLHDSDFIFKLSFSMLWSHCSLCFWDVSLG